MPACHSVGDRERCGVRKMKTERLNIVWNLTRICPYDCKICCVNAIYAPTEDSQKRAKERERQKDRELDLDIKLSILRKIAAGGRRFGFDFSGGDPLLFEEDRRVISYAAELFGRENIMISGTGYSFDRAKINFLRNHTASIEFTLDRLPWTKDPIRPGSYALDSYRALEKCTDHGIPVAISSVMRSDVGIKELEELNDVLKDFPLVGWHLLRLHLAGRARNYPYLVPNDDFYRRAHNFVKNKKRGKVPSIHHSFRNKCEAFSDMIGILADGKVLACCWALDRKGRPISDDFVLGKLPEQDLTEILNSPKTELWKGRNNPCKTDQYLK